MVSQGQSDQATNCFKRLGKLVLPSFLTQVFILDDVKLAE